jgi:ParB-like chromosome segregation protein Spo0J
MTAKRKAFLLNENVRKTYSGIDELAESIRQHGLLQTIAVYVGMHGIKED